MKKGQRKMESGRKAKEWKRNRGDITELGRVRMGRRRRRKDKMEGKEKGSLDGGAGYRRR